MAKIGHSAEANAQSGRASPTDSATSSLGGCVVVSGKKNDDWEHVFDTSLMTPEGERKWSIHSIDLHEKISNSWLVLGFTGEAAPTGDMVSGVASRLKKNPALYDEMKAFCEASGKAHVKAILATGELGTLRNVARASLICMMAGADFIKTSTGKESVNATLPVSLTMIRQIRDYYERTGYHVGYKPAGGISKAKDALTYLALMKEELGNRWLQPDLFRFGASSLLGDIERQLDHFVSGHYSANYRHAMG